MADPTKGPLHYEPKFVFDEDAKSHMMQGPSAQTIAHDMQLAFARDVEGKMRAALIEMGWVPPDAVHSMMQGERGSEREVCARIARQFVANERLAGKTAELVERIADSIEVPF